MNQILGSLGQLYIHSIPTVIFVIILFIVLDRLFFRPIAAVMKARRDATLGAIEAAHKQASAAEAKSRKYDSAIQSARNELYAAREEHRRRAVAEREDSLKSARVRADAMVKEAKASIAAETAAVREELAASSESLAREITGKILGEDHAPNVNWGVRP